MLRTVVRATMTAASAVLIVVAVGAAAVAVALARQPDAFAEEDPFG